MSVCCGVYSLHHTRDLVRVKPFIWCVYVRVGISFVCVYVCSAPPPLSHFFPPRLDLVGEVVSFPIIHVISAEI